MQLKELGVFPDDLEEVLSIIVTEGDGFPLQEIQVLLGGVGVHVCVLSAIGRALQVVPLDDSLIGVEYIGHNDEVNPADDLAFMVLLQQFVQPKESGNQGVRVRLYVVVVVF